MSTMSNTKTTRRTYAPVPYEGNVEKRRAWQAAYRAKEQKRVTDNNVTCQCPEVGHPCPACVTYEQTHYPDTWEARLEAAQAADQESPQVDAKANQEQERAEKRASWQANKAKYLGRYPYHGTLPPGQYVGHCELWQRLTELPHVCERCGVRLFTEEDLPHG